MGDRANSEKQPLDQPEGIRQRPKASDLLKIEESLAGQTERLQKLFDNAPFGIVIIGRDGKYEQVNPRFTELFGFEPGEVPNGREWLRLAFPDPEYRKQVISAWIRDMQELGTGETRQRIFTVQCKDGSKKIVYFRPVKLDTGEDLMTCEDITEHKLAEMQLIESEQKYRTLFEDSNDAVFITTRDGKLIDANRAFLALFGYRRAEAFNMDILHIYSNPADRIRFQKDIEHFGFVKDYQIKFVTKDRTEIECLLNSTLRMSVDGEILGYQGIIRDVTNQKKAEQALIQHEETLRALLNATTDIALLVNNQGEILTLNRQLASSLGKPAEELIGKSIFELSGSEGTLDRQQRLNDIIWTGKPARQEDTTGDGRIYDTSAYPVLRADGSVEGVAVFARDITDRKKAEEELRRSEEKYRGILENIADGYNEVDLKGNLMLVNDSLCEITGYTRERLIGLNYREFVDETNAQRVYEAYNQVYKTGKPNRGLYFEITRMDGSKRYCTVSISLVKDGNGAPCGFRGIFRDITDRRRLEEQLRQAAKMEAIGQLAGGIAHDFNNILTAIIGYSENLSQSIPEGAPYRDKALRINRAAVRAANLTRHLLAFSRKQVLDLKSLDLNALILNFEKMLKPLIGEHIDIVVELSPSAEKVMGDAGQVEQILLNLAVNARDAMPTGGKLVIETGNVFLDDEYAITHSEVTSGPYVMLAVSDTGSGMDSQTMSRIFDPFFTTKTREKGTGLGLSTTYGIVKQHQGHISVYSELARGTTFKIYLPLAPDTVPIEIKDPRTGNQIRGSETILVVEDEELVRELTSEALQALGYKVLEAGDPAEAKKIGEKYKGALNLLLTDVVLPQMDGKRLFGELSPLFPDMRVLYVSGYTENAIVHHGVLDVGVQFLQKPFTMDALARKVREVLDEP
ncbi:MAG: PAS domain S-box protein [Desulfomonilaceae bacterium]